MTCPSVAPGQTLFLLIDVLGFQACQTFENQSRLDLSTLPGLQGTVSNPTGSQTPGASGAANGERVDSSGTVKLASQHCSDLTIGQTHTGFLTGTAITLFITVTNLGTSPAYPPIKVEDTLPQFEFAGPRGLFFVKGGGNGWSCSANGALVTCITDSAIPAGGSSSFTIETTVSEPPGLISNSATVTSCEDTNPQNNLSVRTLVGG